MGSTGLTANSNLSWHCWLRITLQLWNDWNHLSDHSHRGPYDQHTPKLSQRRHCGNPLVFFAEAGPSSITEAMESSEYEDGADDFVCGDLPIDEDEDNDINWQTRSS